MKRVFHSGALLLLILLLLTLPAWAEEEAQEIGAVSAVQGSEGVDLGRLFDKNIFQSQTCPSGSWLQLHHTQGIGSLYLIVDLEYDVVQLTVDGRSVMVDMQDMVHKYINVQALFGRAPQTLTLCFPGKDALVNELYVFTPGRVPDWVQRWQSPAEGETDLLLFSAHGDDEQLFFAGLLPWYAGELDKRVQVVYMTNHRETTHVRVHEMLNGLWTVGVDNYPVFGTFPDFRIDDLGITAEKYHNRGLPREIFLNFVVEKLRRFRPMVAVTHDVNGEYGHGMHRLYADLLMEAVTLSQDETAFPETARQYGVWDVPKTYLHLYAGNPIRMDWDKPLSHFNGLTAYQVSRDLGYPCHISQYEGFAWYYANADTAAQVAAYSPCAYGLFRSTVGLDTEGKDMFENISDRAALTVSITEEPELPTQAVQTETVAAEEEEPIEESVKAEKPWLPAAMLLLVSGISLALLLLKKPSR